MQPGLGLPFPPDFKLPWDSSSTPTPPSPPTTARTLASSLAVLSSTPSTVRSNGTEVSSSGSNGTHPNLGNVKQQQSQGQAPDASTPSPISPALEAAAQRPLTEPPHTLPQLQSWPIRPDASALSTLQRAESSVLKLPFSSNVAQASASDSKPEQPSVMREVST